jgi:hypothetical protein
MVVIFMLLTVTGCTTSKALKNENLKLQQQLETLLKERDVNNSIQVKLGKTRTMKRIVDNMLQCVGNQCGEIVDKQIIAGRTRNDDEFSQETWLIRDIEGDMHVIYLENGIIENIKPYKGEMKKTRFEPVTAK